MTAIAASTPAFHAVLAQPAPPVHAMCESRQAEIERDIEHAKAKGQCNRVRGLEKALRENQDQCRNAKLAQEHKVQERKRDLDAEREKTS